jgi:YggT family protein
VGRDFQHVRHLGGGRRGVNAARIVAGLWAGTDGLFSGTWRAAIRHCAATETAMNPFLWLIDTIITLYIWILIASALLSWLVAFNVVNQRNPIVANLGDFLYRITEPALRPIRAFLPNLGGIDISPVILILLLLFLQRIILWLYIRLFI